MVIPTYCITRITTISIDIAHGIGITYLQLLVTIRFITAPAICSSQNAANYVGTSTIGSFKGA